MNFSASLIFETGVQKEGEMLPVFAQEMIPKLPEKNWGSVLPGFYRKAECRTASKG